MNTTAIDLRSDIVALIEQHLRGVDAATIAEPERWDRYRSFRIALHGVVGCGAEREQQDHGQFGRAIKTFCVRIGL